MAAAGSPEDTLAGVEQTYKQGQRETHTLTFVRSGVKEAMEFELEVSGLESG